MNRRSAVATLPALCIGGSWRLLFGAAVSSGNPSRLRFGLSTNLLTDVNDNDARAAMTVWAETLTKRAGLEIRYAPTVLLSPEKLVEAARGGALDAFAASTVEYQDLAPFIDPSVVVVDEPYAASGGEEYLILAHESGAVSDLASLRNRPLSLYKHPTTCLAPAWLDTLLAAAKLGLPETFLGAISANAKLSRVVLPVYFRQTEACLVTRRGFTTMCEMNPQLAKSLRVIASSPRLLPVFMAFHRSCEPALEARVLPVMLNMRGDAGAKQIFALFQTQGLVTLDISILRRSAETVSAAARLRRGARKVEAP